MQYWVLFFLAAFALSMSSVLSVGSSQSKPSLKDLRRAKAEVFTELHPLSTVDPTKLQIVPRKGRYLQSVGGWAYATLYYNECGAEDDAFVAYGMATDVCLSSETKNGQQSRSFIYSCTDSKYFAWYILFASN
ncbi:hypothetical protein EON65_28095 [archaeon]|nr:MAG: hypothetical protein EON65_28095 [archaeon]